LDAAHRMVSMRMWRTRRFLVVVLILILAAAAGIVTCRSHPPPRAEGTYVGLTREQVLGKLGKPTTRFTGPYGNPPAAWARRFEPCETIVYERGPTTLYISVYMRNGTWVCFASTEVPTGTQF
jgi:hypothetical protein